MIVNDQKPAMLAAASAFTLSFIFALSGAARADTPLPVVAAPTAPQSTQNAAPAPVQPAAPDSETLKVSFVSAGRETPYVTSSKTVGAFLDEHAVHPARGDYVSSAADTPLTDGMEITYRPVVPVVLYADGQKRVVRSTADTVADLLREQGVAPRATDEVSPTRGSHLVPNDVVRVDRVLVWTSKRHERIAPDVTERLDTDLPRGAERTLAAGASGERETTIQFERRNAGATQRTVLASRIIRAPRPKIVARGIAAYASLARVAEHGFASALHFAGSALHVIATAYTAGCYGCSGITASGLRAGFGIIAVDPRVIPLGTRLYVPGYGRAIAGDTGGAIVGRRVDLGFDTVADALRFGRQPMTVYVLK